ncbi:unnamed protein product, partial [Fusarium langsethiae]
MSVPSPNPDPIKYLSKEGLHLILSVSDFTVPLTVGLDAPIDLYVEKFSVSGSLSTLNTNKSFPIRFGLFANTFNVPGDLAKLDISGASGNAREEKAASDESPPQSLHGWHGGNMDIYVERINMSTFQKVKFITSGGDGYTPDHVKGLPDNVVGGNGGDAGQISVIVGSLLSSAFRQAWNILAVCEDPSKNWPGDFNDPVRKVRGLIPENEDLLKEYGVFDALAKAEESLEGSRTDLQVQLDGFTRLLQDLDLYLRSQFNDSIVSTGGAAGTGPTGKRGKTGNDSKPSISSTLMCRMLLSKAKELFYLGTIQTLCESREILFRLGRRLEFLDLLGPDKSAQTTLGHAYAQNSWRLHLPPPTSESQEPPALTQLRAIRGEASGILGTLLSGKDVYGHDKWAVPRLSFHSYKDISVEFLDHLKKAEKVWLDYKTAADKNQATRDSIRDGKATCDRTKASCLRLIQEVKIEMSEYEKKIDKLTPILKEARDQVLQQVKDVEEEIKHTFKVPFHDIVEAFGQILMVHGAGMAALQGVNLLQQAGTTIPDDSGTHVNKDYLIRQVSDIEGTIASLNEGYKMSKDGKIDLLDPGASKLQLAKKELDRLLQSFWDTLGSKRLKSLKKAFQDYITFVLQRNNAVVGYNAAVTLLARYHAE